MNSSGVGRGELQALAPQHTPHTQHTQHTQHTWNGTHLRMSSILSRAMAPYNATHDRRL